MRTFIIGLFMLTATTTLVGCVDTAHKQPPESLPALVVGEGVEISPGSGFAMCAPGEEAAAFKQATNKALNDAVKRLTGGVSRLQHDALSYNGLVVDYRERNRNMQNGKCSVQLDAAIDVVVLGDEGYKINANTQGPIIAFALKQYIRKELLDEAHRDELAKSGGVAMNTSLKEEFINGGYRVSQSQFANELILANANFNVAGLDESDRWKLIKYALCYDGAAYLAIGSVVVEDFNRIEGVMFHSVISGEMTVLDLSSIHGEAITAVSDTAIAQERGREASYKKAFGNLASIMARKSMVQLRRKGFSQYPAGFHQRLLQQREIKCAQ